MTKRSLFQALLLRGAMLLGCGLAPSARAAAATPPKDALPPRPNVLLIMSDDLNVALGCYGDSRVKTPNIDRLAARGMLFERAYCNYPLCNPSRTSILSGLRPDTSTVTNNDRYLRGVTWLPEYFKRHGYFTARVGKLEHGSEEVSRGARPPLIAWELQDSSGAGNAPLVWRDFLAAQKAGLNPAPVKPQQIVEYRALDTPEDEESDVRTARRIAQLMEQHRDRPFFLGAGFYRPHLPFVAPRKYFDLYPPDSIVLPSETEPAGDREDIPAIALTSTKEAERLSELEKRRTIAAYYACISFMDAQVGVMLDALDRLQLSEHTIIVFMGDHGFHLGEHAGRGGPLGLWRKQTLFEESLRTPLLVVAPGVRPGTRTRSLVEFVDVYPTLVELAGLPASTEIDGASLAPLLADPGRTWRNAIFSQVERGRTMGRAIRTDRFAYNRWGSTDTVELYDHASDPREYRNLAPDPAHAETRRELERIVQRGPDAALTAGIAPPARRISADGRKPTTHPFKSAPAAPAKTSSPARQTLP